MGRGQSTPEGRAFPIYKVGRRQRLHQHQWGCINALTQPHSPGHSAGECAALPILTAVLLLKGESSIGRIGIRGAHFWHIPGCAKELTLRSSCLAGSGSAARSCHAAAKRSGSCFDTVRSFAGAWKVCASCLAGSAIAGSFRAAAGPSPRVVMGDAAATVQRHAANVWFWWLCQTLFTS
jgi:hypothetical protein